MIYHILIDLQTKKLLAMNVSTVFIMAQADTLQKLGKNIAVWSLIVNPNPPLERLKLV